MLPGRSLQRSHSNVAAASDTLTVEKPPLHLLLCNSEFTVKSSHFKRSKVCNYEHRSEAADMITFANNNSKKHLQLEMTSVCARSQKK